MNILGWPDWRIVSIEDRGSEYLIETEKSNTQRECLHCGSDQVHHHGRKRQIFLDTPVHGKRSALLVHRRRFLCQSCHRSFLEPLAEMHPAHFMTTRLVSYIEQQALRHTFVSVAESVGVTEGTVRQVFAAYQKRQQQDIVMSAPSQIGIDEVKIDGAMRCVIVDMKQHCILEILPDRKKSTVLHFLLQLPKREHIEWVTMDMWKSYLDVVHQALPQARVAVDKFHVVRLTNRALEGVRRRIRKSLSDKQRKTLMHDKYILLHRKKDLSESQLLILAVWTLNLPDLGTAYELKESYCDVWDASTREAAMTLYAVWRKRVPAHLEEDFKPLLTAMENWETEIFNYFEAKLTNAYTEALNGIIKRLVHLSRGASLSVIRAKIRLHAGLHCPPQPGLAERRKKRRRKETEEVSQAE
jgi:transposase